MMNHIFQRCAGCASVLVLLGGLVAGCAGTTGKTGPSPSAGSAPRSADGSSSAGTAQKVADAVRDARDSGRSSVDVFLDEQPEVVQAGDLVQVQYRAWADKQPVRGNDNGIVEIVAGRPTRLPGLGQAVTGMKVNQSRSRTIAPEQGFGPWDENRVQAFASVRDIPLTLTFSVSEYEKKFSGMPSPGEKVQINPMFTSRVVSVGQDKITLENLPEDGLEMKQSFGTTTVTVQGNKILVRLLPVKGAMFKAGNKEGIIVKIEPDRFWVDFNHPLAGRTLKLDFTVKAITKASVLQKKQITWIEDHDFGMHVAKKRNLDVVLFLYADWCSWCKKMMSSTFNDPRIRMHKDEFVWVKVNSDQEKQIGQQYRQEGFPLTVLLDDHGKIVKQISGFRTADQLLPELLNLTKTAEQSRAK